MKEKLKYWFLENADSKESFLGLFFVSFIEASFFIIPPDFFLIPLVLAKRKKWIHFFLVTTTGSVAGALLGYVIGLFFFEFFGAYIINLYNLHEEFLFVESWYAQNAFIAIFVSAFTIIPFKVFTITAGLFKINIFVFLLASILGRGIRFFIIGFIVSKYGKYFGKLAYKYFNMFSILLILLLVAFISTFL